MYQVDWDPETGGVLLKESISTGIGKEVRPVFYEELDLFGFDKHWSYPHSRNPLLWAVGRRYFYRGIEVAQAKGGNIFEAPEIILTEEGKALDSLDPIDMNNVVEKNLEALYVIENEALDFIEHVYNCL